MNLPRTVRIVSCVAIVALMSGAPTGPAAAAPPGGGGGIAGRVVDVHGDPLAGICVQLENGPSTTTDVSGLYSFSGLMPGDYRLSYEDCVDHLLFTTWYFKADDATGAQLVNVTSGTTTNLTDEPMFLGASVEGTVRRDGTGAPLGGVCVDATTPTSGGYSVVGSATTLANGSYRMDQLPSADVRIRFHSCATVGPDVEVWNGGAFNQNDADQIHLTSGLVVSNVDASMQRGVGVAGIVTDTTGTPLPNMTININPVDDDGPSGWAMTDVNGGYQTSALPPGDYRVEFKDNANSPTWATQYWSGKAVRTDADPLTIDLADAPQLTGIDAQLAVGSSISGTVTAAGGAPLVGICVAAIDSSDQLGGLTSTAASGAYTITGLAATTFKVAFVDCGPPELHVQQWWEDAPGPFGATTITLAVGEHRTGIDAQLRLASFITGTVTDQQGQPLEEVCVTALGSDRFGGVARTDSNGEYSMAVPGTEPYDVQFVDCGTAPAHAGQWFDGHPIGSSDRSGAAPVAATNGQTVAGIDAVLVGGANGTISGRVVSRHGLAMTNVCVIAYLPDNHVRVAGVQTDGSYTITDIPSGSYGLAFMDCTGSGDPSNRVPDPEASSTVYQGLWWGGARVVPSRNTTRFDPLDQGATLVEVGAGATLTGFDLCFGCVTITITAVTAQGDNVSVGFTVDGPVFAANLAWLSSVQYTATCTSSDGGATRSASGTSSPIVVGGVTPGKRYTCTVVAADDTSAVGRSAPSSPVVVAASSAVEVPIPTTSAAPSPDAAPATAHAPRELAMTGGNLAPIVTLAGILLIVGGLIQSVPRRRRS